jgi:hypothetical protein
VVTQQKKKNYGQARVAVVELQKLLARNERGEGGEPGALASGRRGKKKNFCRIKAGRANSNGANDFSSAGGRVGKLKLIQYQ